MNADLPCGFSSLFLIFLSFFFFFTCALHSSEGDPLWPLGVIDATNQERVNSRGANSESGCCICFHTAGFYSFFFLSLISPHMMMLGNVLHHGLSSPNGHISLICKNNNNNNPQVKEDTKFIRDWHWLTCPSAASWSLLSAVWSETSQT